MVNITSFEDDFYYPPQLKGLEALIRFPDGEYKRRTIPNSTIWVFDSNEHKFNLDILGSDVGCGMTAFVIAETDHKEAADKIYDYLKGRGILGRGNHFVDICTGIESSSDEKTKNHNILFLHTHGKEENLARSVTEAKRMQKKASEERKNLGYELAGLLKKPCELLGDWPHNTVEEKDGKVIYRKGVVKVEPLKLFLLPAHVGAYVWAYTVDKKNLPPYSSMPHATGRKGPRKKTKVDLDNAASVRDYVYVPEDISDSSLRTEHPECFNGFDKIINKLGGGGKNYIVSVGKAKILSYVGKI